MSYFYNKGGTWWFEKERKAVGAAFRFGLSEVYQQCLDIFARFLFLIVLGCAVSKWES
jgi:hypothetical protein